MGHSGYGSRIGRARSLPLTVETALYRAAQEGLTNVARHAQATQAEVTLHQSPHLITCSVRDDGKGCRSGGRW